MASKNRVPYKSKLKTELEEVSVEMGKILHDLQRNLPNNSNSKKALTKMNSKVRPQQTPKPKLGKLPSTNQSRPIWHTSKINSVEKYSNPSTKTVFNKYTNQKIIPTKNVTSKPLIVNKPVNLQRLPSKGNFNSRVVDKSPTMNLHYDEVLKQLNNKVQFAIKEKKTFTLCGNLQSIRNALVARGWVEKIRTHINSYDYENLKRLLGLPITQLVMSIHDEKKGDTCRRVIMSKLLGKNQVDFYWDQNLDCFRVCPDNVKFTLFNRIKRGISQYTSKCGLSEAMKTCYWFKTGVSNINYPRTYNLSNEEEATDFINDFRLTACMSLIKYMMYNIQTKQVRKIIAEDGKVPLSVYTFAVSELNKFIRKSNHDDIDFEIESAKAHEWSSFLEEFYRIVHIGVRFKPNRRDNAEKILQTTISLFAKLKVIWPPLHCDGTQNIWILKPFNSCRGQGIFLCRTLQYITKITKLHSDKRYIIQKYIENPLLIYNTKFDIRQWFLISSTDPLTIWIYKDCYLRFSTQLYTLNKLSETIHLTNNSIQSKYRNCSDRSKNLPNCNMWDSKQFREYLEKIGYAKAFDHVIYPGMKEAISTAIINQSSLDTRKNSFELYGSDFMVTPDFKPWLIEINAHPALFGSTPVTSRMCPRVLEDLIKVIIDHNKIPSASTGQFELLYKEKQCILPPIKSLELHLHGKKLSKSYFSNLDDRAFKTKAVARETVIEATNRIKSAIKTFMTGRTVEHKDESNNTSIENPTSKTSLQLTKNTHSLLLTAPTTKMIAPSKSDIKKTKSENSIQKSLNEAISFRRNIFKDVIQSMKDFTETYENYKQTSNNQ
ncbi:hypothetical protein FQA39_LY12295 [Lamprigera yunnana]|nr:hypothetical protein FQA39_LY12295 [Lamprigera yunnana]